MLLYEKEHTSCFNYQKESDFTLDIIKFRTGETLEKDIVSTSIVFTLSGTLLLSSGKEVNKMISSGKMILLVPGSHVRMVFKEGSSILINQIKDKTHLCDCFPIEKLYTDKTDRKEGRITMLDINSEISDFLQQYIHNIRNGLKCTYYTELKSKELFFLLRAYYSKDDLNVFFKPLMNGDMRFSRFVYQHFRSVNSVNELIRLSPYSVSGFKKQFQKTFGTSASVWLREQKAKRIYHDLNCSGLSIKELCYKFEFASVPSFNAFCKNHFGLPPGEIRKKRLSQE